MTEEIRHALAVELDESELDPGNLPDLEDIVSVCAGLVTVDEESHIIRLVHYTTQVYFEQIRDKWNPGAQLECALTCLTYLSFDPFKAGPCNTDQELSSRVEQHSFSDYAANNWGHHAVEVQREVRELACSFLLDRSLLACAVQIMYLGSGNLHPERVTSLHILAKFGLHILSEEILPRLEKETLISVNARDIYGRTPLYEAAMRGHDAMVYLLLNKGADVNAQEGNISTALLVASRGGHEGVVKLLLDKGANVNAQGKQLGNALQAASWSGREEIVMLLLEKGADVNLQGGRYGSALMAASGRGHERIVKLLLNKGADIYAHDGPYRNALQAAAEGGHEQLIQLFLDKGVDINAQGGQVGSALMAASAGGHEGIVKMLLDKGANINARGGVCGSALLAALEKGHEQLVMDFLSKGADVNCLGGTCGSFLNFLAFRGNTHLLRLAYEQHHATQSLVDFHDRTVLQLAARGGHIDTFRYLTDLGLNPKTNDAKGDNLLSYASSGGSVQVLNAVLEMDPMASMLNRHWSPLHWACRTGNIDIIERLVEKRGHSECVSLLHPEGQWSPVSIAVFHGNAKALEGLSPSCRSLLGVGADSNAESAVHFGIGSYNGYWCSGCFHVSKDPKPVRHFSYQIEHLRTTFPLSRLSRFRLLFHVQTFSKPIA